MNLMYMPTAPVPRPSKSPVGAIAGGIVGGLAALALLIGLLFALVHKRKQNQQRDAHLSDTIKISSELQISTDSAANKIPQIEHVYGDMTEAEANGSERHELLALQGTSELANKWPAASVELGDRGREPGELIGDERFLDQDARTR